VTAPKLGDLLVQAGVLTRGQIEEALQRQQALPGRTKLGEVILAMGMTTEEAILAVLSHAMHLPAHDLDKSPPTPDAVAWLPAGEARKHSIVPVRLESEGRRRRLILAMCDPTNVQVIDDLQFRTGMVVRPVVTTASQVRRAIRLVYPEVAAAGPNGEPAPEGAPRARAEVAELKVVAGPAKGQRYMVPFQGSLDFGRGEHVEISIPDPRMSRRHFLVVDTGEGLELVDLGSSDGTIVNQQAKRRAMLKTGDSIAAGDTVLTVSVLSGE
jgi:hypothetical protein